MTSPAKEPVSCTELDADDEAWALENLVGLVVRPVQPDDDERLVRMHSRLSPETIYKRFHTPMPTPSPALIKHLANVDGTEREALVVLFEDEIVAVARWDCDHDDATKAEIAILVEDAWQGRGVGRWLIGQLAAAAAEAGVDTFDAMVLSDNRAPMVALMRSALGEVHADFDDGEIHLTADLTHHDDIDHDVVLDLDNDAALA